MSCTIRMSSEVYGSEDFQYGSIDEARAGMDRLEQSINEQADGVERKLTLILDEREIGGGYEDDEDEYDSEDEDNG